MRVLHRASVMPCLLICGLVLVFLPSTPVQGKHEAGRRPFGDAFNEGVFAPGKQPKDGKKPAGKPAEEQKPTEKRPFGKRLSQEEANKTWQATINDDATALQTVKAGGLSYLIPFRSARRQEDIKLANSLLRSYRDWVSAMQAWECVLSGPNSEDVAAQFFELEKRFFDPEPQLARAIFHAWYTGDAATLQLLLDASKTDAYLNTSWIKMVRGYVEESLSVKERVTLLLEGATADEYYDRLPQAFFFYPPCVLPEEPHPEEESELDDFRRSVCQDFVYPTGVDSLVLWPSECTHYRIAERATALAMETNNTTLLAQITKTMTTLFGKHKNAKAVAPEGSTEPDVIRIARSAWEATADKAPPYLTYAPTMVRWGGGAELAGFIRLGYLENQPLERQACAILSFYSNPECGASQRIFLETCLRSSDSFLSVLAIRAVLALRDDCYDGYRNVARELAAAPAHKALLKSFQDALTASKHAKLKALGKALGAGSQSISLTEGWNERLRLSVAEKVALLRPFMYPEEIDTYGSVETVYHNNRAHFLSAIQRHVPALDAYAQALTAAYAVKQDTEGMHARAIHTYFTDFTGGHCNVLADVEKAEARLAANARHAYEELQAVRAVQADEKAPLEQRPIPYITALLNQQGGTFSNELRETLLNHPRRWSGWGIALVAKVLANQGRHAEAAKYFAQAERCSPLQFAIPWEQSQAYDEIATYYRMNWRLAERLTLRVLMHRPWSLYAMRLVGSCELRSGECGLALDVQCWQASLRPSLNLPLDAIPDIFRWVTHPSEPAALMMRKLGAAQRDSERAQFLRKVIGTCAYITAFHAHRYDKLTHMHNICAWPYLGMASFSAFSQDTGEDFSDVSRALDEARCLGRLMPQTCLKLIDMAEKAGVSKYGHFVGSQAFVEAATRTQRFDDAFRRYNEMRGQEVGRPGNLDIPMLDGLFATNDYGHLEEVLGAIQKHEDALEGCAGQFALRRALMALEKYPQAAAVNIPAPHEQAFCGPCVLPFANAFFLAPGFFASEDFAAMIDSVLPYLELKTEDGMGTIADAALLAALAEHERLAAQASSETKSPDDPSEAAFPARLLTDDVLALFGETPEICDWHLLRILAGKAAWDSLPQVTSQLPWHGYRYAEHPPMGGSSLFVRPEISARDDFVRGVLAYLAGHKDVAKKHLDACVLQDQRFRHEWHIARWLVNKRIGSKDAEGAKDAAKELPKEKPKEEPKEEPKEKPKESPKKNPKKASGNKPG